MNIESLYCLNVYNGLKGFKGCVVCQIYLMFFKNCVAMLVLLCTIIQLLHVNLSFKKTNCHFCDVVNKSGYRFYKDLAKCACKINMKVK
jgi:hypothetical protein